MKILRSPWTWLVVVAVVALLLWKNRGPIISVFRPAPLPTGTSTGVNLTEQQAQMVRSLSQRLWTDIDKWNNPWFNRRDTEAWTQLLELSEPLFIAVFNDFGNLYYAREGKTLKTYLEEENFALTSSINTAYGIYTGTRLKNELLSRMNTLNLQ